MKPVRRNHLSVLVSRLDKTERAIEGPGARVLFPDDSADRSETQASELLLHFPEEGLADTPAGRIQIHERADIALLGAIRVGQAVLEAKQSARRVIGHCQIDGTVWQGPDEALLIRHRDGLGHCSKPAVRDNRIYQACYGTSVHDLYLAYPV